MRAFSSSSMMLAGRARCPRYFLVAHAACLGQPSTNLSNYSLKFHCFVTISLETRVKYHFLWLSGSWCVRKLLQLVKTRFFYVKLPRISFLGFVTLGTWRWRLPYALYIVIASWSRLWSWWITNWSSHHAICQGRTSSAKVIVSQWGILPTSLVG